MKLEEFKAGTHKQQYQYKSFSPQPINKNWIWLDPSINVLLEKATQSLGELNAFSIIVPNVDLFIKMHIVKEANTSSRIEGTKTKMDEAVMAKEDILPERRDDWQEVYNYIKAINQSIEELETLPLSSRLLCNTHKILMSSVRGEHKTPGEFRKSQNWIGGSGLSDAVFIPPGHDEINDLMSDLENFWHAPDIQVPHLIKIALSHYQFETIHPFLDGNGRIGRLMITLYLVNFGLLKQPTLYLSDFFERNRASYYDALSHGHDEDDIIHWIKFFLQAVIEIAGKSIDTFNKILILKNETDILSTKLRSRADNVRRVIELFYQTPFLHVKDISKSLSITDRSIRNIVNDLMKEGMIVETTGTSRNRLYLFKKYFSLF
ncbi:MAG: Fic family protein [Candidatus Cloacimonetes bacterium]|nr:Fic family protein [Candidatus Cloacimonadota bacterium]